jgi:cell division protein FtsB
MSEPNASEPLDATPAPGSRAAAPPDPPDGIRRLPLPDLAAVPSFLRGRRDLPGRGGAAPRSPAAAPVAAATPDVASLPMLRVAPRRLILVGATILLAWLIVSFGRQVAEASASSARAEALRAANAELSAEVAAMERELDVIQDQRYISQAARAFRLGSPNEIPFALQAGAPPLPADAPGSAAVKLGAQTVEMSPLERWLDVLFGPGG